VKLKTCIYSYNFNFSQKKIHSVENNVPMVMRTDNIQEIPVSNPSHEPVILAEAYGRFLSML